MNKKPLLYLTRDDDGLHLWFSLEPPRLRKIRDGHGESRYRHRLAESFRLPLSWFGGLLKTGECRIFDPDELFSRLHPPGK
ncbi:MAG: hypothetical protein LBU64_02415 [Planctomycetota bacterium]|nr:hypothetical protein [Planctomycetota bacterium]